MSPKLIKAFWSKVKITPGCWEWTASQITNGYGVFRMASRRGLSQYPHRFSYLLHFGAFPEHLHVLHKCDNRLCVNPDHLFLGTHQDNVRDMVSKGRNFKSRGESNPGAKLTKEQVQLIRQDSRTQVAIAKEYGISQPQVSYIKSGKQWTHLS